MDETIDDRVNEQEHRLAGADRSSIFFLKVKGLSFSITKEGGCGGVGVVVIWEGTRDGLGGFHQMPIQQEQYIDLSTKPLVLARCNYRSPVIKRNDMFFAAKDINGTNVLTKFHEE
ncbi:hypothetical protein DPMN_098205 [Dreissena polymorpha]|uniref:Uncharacterized protein n=1 Tax=Dreissena polymorpha TaxID=45954 RepID=A0A9D4LBQ5_DREPO|nr:hypothetical protein DPMN_098205 [Dreissena polymorpha]